MAAPKSYWGERVIGVIGAHELTGVVKYTVRPIGDGIGSTESMDGQLTRWGKSWTRCEIDVELLQSSPSNDVLSSILSVDKKSNGAGTFAFALSDLNGSSMVTASSAWVRNYPEQGFTDTGDQTRSWTIETDSSTQLNAGGI